MRKDPDDLSVMRGSSRNLSLDDASGLSILYTLPGVLASSAAPAEAVSGFGPHDHEISSDARAADIGSNHAAGIAKSPLYRNSAFL